MCSALKRLNSYEVAPDTQNKKFETFAPTNTDGNNERVEHNEDVVPRVHVMCRPVSRSRRTGPSAFPKFRKYTPVYRTACKSLHLNTEHSNTRNGFQIRSDRTHDNTCADTTKVWSCVAIDVARNIVITIDEPTVIRLTSVIFGDR